MDGAISVDQIKCQAIGTCHQIAPHAFELDEWGYAVATGDGRHAGPDAELLRRAVDGCPAGAVRFIDPQT